MLRLGGIAVVLFALAFGSCSSEQSRTVSLHCITFRMEPGNFLDQGMREDQNHCVLTDIETFFLVDFGFKARSTAKHFKSGRKTRLVNSMGRGKSEEWVEVIGRESKDKLNLEISSPQESEVQLHSNVHVELSPGGSTIIRTANPLKDGRRTYWWIVNATRHEVDN